MVGHALFQLLACDKGFRVRVAGIDYGQARVGIAVSDDLGLMAHPRPHLDGRNRSALFDALKAFAAQEGIEQFVVGLPRNLDGSEGTSARRARHFARLLERTTGVPVQFVDEWLTTQEATRRLREQGVDARRGRARVDSAAAAILLQSFLDARPAAREREQP
jgi:putative Holliday junction resolvase